MKAVSMMRCAWAAVVLGAVGFGVWQWRRAEDLAAELEQQRREERSSRASAPSAATRGPVSRVVPVPARAPDSGSNASAGISRPFDWRRVESADYREYIANLRAVGCPEETLRDIIRADVGKLYEEKKKAVRRAAPEWEYWTSLQGYIRGPGMEMWKQWRDLDDERDGVLRALGMEPDTRKKAGKERNAQDLLLGFLDEGKRAQVLRVRQDLEDRLAMRDPGSLDAAAIEQLIEESEEAARRLLTTSEAREYELRVSRTAQKLVRDLEGLGVSREEYDAVFDLVKAHEARHPASRLAGETEAGRAAAQRELIAAVAGVLGAERAQAFGRARGG